ncbi:MAG: hypothetical protein ACTSYF_02860 [Promethearchaeota archaeon]
MKIVVISFGTENIKGDNLANQVSKELKKDFPDVEFIECYDPSEILNYYDYDKIFIIDVVKGIDDVIVIDDLNILKNRKIFTGHDFDIGFFLKIINKLWEGNKIKIIGLPFDETKINYGNHFLISSSKK